MEQTAAVVLTQTEANQIVQHLDASIRANGINSAVTAVVILQKLREAFATPQAKPSTESAQ